MYVGVITQERASMHRLVRFHVGKIQMGSDLKFYINVLKSDECQCGRCKKPRNALCNGCYNRLPAHMKRALYRRLRDGFEYAYDNAVEWLNS